MPRPLFLILAACALAAACSAPESVPAPEPAPTRESRPRSKAVELYSWQEEGGQWIFALVDGTNRLKPVGEIQKQENRIVGIGALTAAFATLAVGEQVFWLHHVQGFEFPDEALRSNIERSAKQAGLEMHGPW